MIELTKLMQQQFDKMMSTGALFRSSVPGSRLWELYLQSFSEENDPVFRDPNSTTHNCNHCNNFIRRYGNIVAIDNEMNIISIFDIDAPDEYKDSCKAMSEILRENSISDVFYETYHDLNSLPYEKVNKKMSKFQLGVAFNHKRYTAEEANKYPGVVQEDEIRKFNHFHLLLDKAFVDFSGKSIESIMGEHRDAYAVFSRGLGEIPLATLELVKDLIVQGSLLNGDAYLSKLEAFIRFKKNYEAVDPHLRENWCWRTSLNLSIAKFRNELIGVLCTELAEGKDLNKACKDWNIRIDPVNYMKATAPITKKQIAEAEKFVESNGYTESFDRRFATLSDINVTEIKHINSGEDTLPKASLFADVKATKSHQHKRSRFDGIEEVSIDKFMKDILPGCTSVELFLENKHADNLVALHTAKDPNSKPMFKWSNNYGWTYSNNLTGKSHIKEAVKSRGGNVEAPFRFSINWAEGPWLGDNSDLDAWCILPNGSSIGYSRKNHYDTGGKLDVDIQYPGNYDKNIVENIYFPSLGKLIKGTYKFYVNQFSDRGSKGFNAELECNGQVFTYTYPKKVSGNIHVVYVNWDGYEFTVNHKLEAAESVQNLWGLDTNKFHKVNLLSLSPNFWAKNAVGNKHYFFFLDKCRSDKPLKSFHVEYLNSELRDHRKVMEVLTNTTMLEATSKQLAGVGFNATVKNEVVLRLKGNFQRVIKICF